jgi:Ca2+-binding EF-hand superfamily protein
MDDKLAVFADESWIYAMCRPAFDSINKNQNGNVDRPTFEQLLTSEAGYLGVNMTKSDAANTLDLLDPERTGEITFEGYKDYMRDLFTSMVSDPSWK